MFPVYKTGITLNELPDKISFYIQFHSCNIRCVGCHSKFLWNKIDKYISLENLITISEINKNKGCDSIIIFGDINNNISVVDFKKLCKELSDILPICVYSGADSISESLGDEDTLRYLSYIKLGHYDINLGGLACKSTNQRLYMVKNGKIDKNITYKFWR